MCRRRDGAVWAAVFRGQDMVQQSGPLPVHRKYQPQSLWGWIQIRHTPPDHFHRVKANTYTSEMQARKLVEVQWSEALVRVNTPRASSCAVAVAVAVACTHTQKLPSAGSIVWFFLLWRPWGLCSGKGNAVLCSLCTQRRASTARGQALSAALILVATVNI